MPRRVWHEQVVRFLHTKMQWWASHRQYLLHSTRQAPLLLQAYTCAAHTCSWEAGPWLTVVGDMAAQTVLVAATLSVRVEVARMSCEVASSAAACSDAVHGSLQPPRAPLAPKLMLRTRMLVARSQVRCLFVTPRWKCSRLKSTTSTPSCSVICLQSLQHAVAYTVTGNEPRAQQHNPNAWVSFAFAAAGHF